MKWDSFEPSSSSLFPHWGSGSIRELPLHRNPGLELVYVSRGHLHWRIEDRTFEVGPGSVFYTLPWEMHGSLDEFEPGHAWDFVVIGIAGAPSPQSAYLPSAQGFSKAAGRQLLSRLHQSPHRSIEAGEMIPWLLPALCRELSAGNKCSFQIAAALTHAILLELDRIVGRTGPTPRSEAVRRRTDRFELLLQRLDKDVASSWTLRDMLGIAGGRRTHLGRLFKERTGDSPMTYLNRLRVTKAQEQLRRTQLQVTEVAFACGFQSSQYFARVFKQFAGDTPQNYRSKWRPRR